MTQIDIHNVLSIELQEVIGFAGTATTEPFFTRNIVITDRDGHETVIKCFASGKVNLTIEA